MFKIELLNKKVDFTFSYLYVGEWTGVCDCLCPIPKDLEITNTVVSYLIWMLAFELESSAKSAQALHHCALSSPKIEHYLLVFMLVLEDKTEKYTGEITFIVHICLSTKIEN